MTACGTRQACRFRQGGYAASRTGPGGLYPPVRTLPALKFPVSPCSAVPGSPPICLPARKFSGPPYPAAPGHPPALLPVRSPARHPFCPPPYGLPSRTPPRPVLPYRPVALPGFPLSRTVSARAYAYLYRDRRHPRHCRTCHIQGPPPRLWPQLQQVPEQ